MKQHRFGSHTPEEMRRLSDLGHKLEGGLLAAVGLLALAAAAGLGAWASIAWAALLLVAGIVLLIAIYPRHPMEDWPAIWNDPQQRQHTLIAVAITIAGAVELARLPHLAALRYIWPVIATLIGILFLTHAQHGTGEAVEKATWQHRILGITVIVAGLLRGAEILANLPMLGYFWPVALLAAAAQLLLYHEPAGAYEPGSGHAHH